MKKGRGKFFVSRIVVFCLIFVLMFSLLFLWYGRYVDGKEAEYKIDSSNDFSKACERLEYCITAVQSISQMLLYDDCIKKYAMDGVVGYADTDFENLTVISNKLAKYQGYFSYMDFSIAVTKLDDGVMVVNSTTYSQNDGLNFLSLEPENFEGENLDKTAAGMYSDIIINSNANRNLSVLQKQIYPDGTYVYIIYSFRNSSCLSNESNALAVFNNTGIISNISGMSSRESKKIDKLLKECDFTDSKKVTDLLEKSGFNVFVYGNDNLDDCTCVYLYRDYYSHKNIAFFVIAFISLLAAYFLSPRIVRLVYMPVINALKLFNGGEEELSEANYFTVLEQKVNELVLNQSEHMDYMSKNSDRIKNTFLLELLNGIMSKEKYDEMTAKFNLHYMNAPCRCIAFSIFYDDSVDYGIDGKDIIEVKESIFDCLKQFISDNFEGDIIASETNTYIGVVRSEENIKSKFSELLEKINEIIEIKLIMAIGREVPSGFGAGNSYFDVLEILEQKGICSDSGVFEEKDLNIADQIYYPIVIEKTIIECITQNNLEKAQNMLTMLVSRNLDSPSVSRKAVNSFEFAIIQTLQRILYYLNTEEKDVFPDGMIVYLELKMCKTAEEKKSKILQIFEYVFEYVRNNFAEKGENRYGRSILNYIDENYTDDISLTDISESLGISVSLICSIMKEQYNTTFKNYINHKRVEAACELLDKNPSIKIIQLAERVGCNNTTTLTRLFKKYKGITPGDYIKNSGKI